MSKQQLYELIIHQLEKDGHFGAMNKLIESSAVAPPTLAPTTDLATIVAMAPGENPSRGQTLDSTYQDFDHCKHSFTTRCSVFPPLTGPFQFYLSRPTNSSHQGTPAAVYCAAFSSTGKVFAFAGEGGSVRLCSVAHARQAAQADQSRASGRDKALACTIINGNGDGDALCMAAHPFLPLFAIGHESGAVSFWAYTPPTTAPLPIATAHARPTWTHTVARARVTALAWSADGGSLLLGLDGCAGLRVLFLTGTAPALRRALPAASDAGNITAIAVGSEARNEEGDTAAWVGYSSGLVAVHDVVSGAVLALVPTNDYSPINSIQVDSRGQNALIFTESGNCYHITSLQTVLSANSAPAKPTETTHSQPAFALRTLPPPLPFGRRAQLAGSVALNDAVAVAGVDVVGFVGADGRELQAESRPSEGHVSGVVGAPTSAPMVVSFGVEGAVLWFENGK